MARAVESTNSSINSTDVKSEVQPEQKKPEHLHLVGETNDHGIRVGTRLRNARVERSLNIEDVAKTLKFRREYIEAIENMQVSLLPKGLVNPYIRDYARFLGLDAAKAVEDFNIQCGALSQAEELIPQTQTKSNDKTHLVKFGMAIAVVLLMAIGAWSAYNMFTKQIVAIETDSAPAIALTPGVNGARTPVMQTATPALSQLNDTIKLKVHARERAWIEIRGADGTLFIDRQFAAGETYDLRVGAGWTLTTQNAGAFEWIVNGETSGLVGEQDQPLYTLGVDEVAIALAKTKE